MRTARQKWSSTKARCPRPPPMASCHEELSRCQSVGSSFKWTGRDLAVVALLSHRGRRQADGAADIPRARVFRPGRPSHRADPSTQGCRRCSGKRRVVPGAMRSCLASASHLAHTAAMRGVWCVWRICDDSTAAVLQAPGADGGKPAAEDRRGSGGHRTAARKQPARQPRRRDLRVGAGARAERAGGWAGWGRDATADRRAAGSAGQTRRAAGDDAARGGGVLARSGLLFAWNHHRRQWPCFGQRFTSSGRCVHRWSGCGTSTHSSSNG